MLKSLALLSLTVAPGAYAWGALGHETVAYVASSFVSDKTKTYCQDILGDTTTSYLANVASWADTYRSTAAGAFSSDFHYIDAEDNPPSSCGVDYDRDCGDSGCVVSAINNYTARIQDTSLSADQTNQALKFIVHFLGDIHQPLHDEELDIGGNSIDVLFNSKKTNLHSVWDTAMIAKLTGGDSISLAKTLGNTLATSIRSGSYKSMAASWLDGMDISDPVASSLIWAQDANAYVCSTVIPDGVSAVENMELDGAYYNKAIPVIQLQLAKAGYRLAAWLELIATGAIHV
ncbi:MAG: hypothetical protein M4579_006882 [Chaenotheca gracillima]|nr:MAG: hypothetical protein M4579_006882 [Chaenotheca gracillima]